MENETREIALAGLFIACGSILAVTFHTLNLGAIIIPMHIVVMLAGLLLGKKYGLLVGILTPLLNSIMFSSPPLFPIAIGMSIELAIYGFIIGLIHTHIKPFNNEISNIYIALITSMIIGRIAYGVYYSVVSQIITLDFGFEIFITSVIITPLPGIILQLLIIPPIYSIVKTKKES